MAKHGSNKRSIIITIIGAVIGLGIGIVIGHFGIEKNVDPTLPPTVPPSDDVKLDPIGLILSNVDNGTISEYLKVLAKDPHTAGTYEDEVVLVDFITQNMREANLKVKISEYEVLLSYPKREEGMRNYVAVHDQDGNIITDAVGNEVKSAEVEEILAASQDNPLVFNPFIGYAKAGNITGDMIYVNYARIEDFMYLTETDMTVEGNICIARYGMIFRGNKARYAEEYGCIGLILFSDSADYAREWIGPYPESWYLPKTGAQRGTTHLEEGDPETPFYPSIPGAYSYLSITY